MNHENEILFNSPALHSLKRAQLSALCKRYNIKQSGKNEELVERLHEYAQTLVNHKENDPQSRDFDASQNDNETEHNNPTASTNKNERNSQQWELVEDNGSHEQLPSVDNAHSRTRTLSLRSAMSVSVASTRSAKEFAMNTLSSTKSGKSLMSIANSLKRTGSKSSKMSISTSGSGSDNSLSTRASDRISTCTSSTSEIITNPMSHLFPAVPTEKPLPPTNKDDDVEESLVEPAQVESSKGDLSRPIIEGDVDASNLTFQEQPTVRLVTPGTRRLLRRSSVKNAFPTPQLKPFNPAASVSEMSEQSGPEGIGRAFITMDRRSFTETVQSRDIDDSLTESDVNATLKASTVNSSPHDKSIPDQTVLNKESATGSPHFVFGSPVNPGVSNLQFGNAAAAILEEMNKRLGLDTSSAGAARLGKDGKFDFGEVPVANTGLQFKLKAESGGRYDKAHEKVFEKMSSIVDHYTNKRPPSPLKSAIGTKRKSTVAFDEQASARNGRRIINLDNPKDKANEPITKRQKVDGAELAKQEKLRIPTGENDKARKSTVTMKDDEATLKRLARERERRSSRGRTSGGGISATRRKSLTSGPAKVAQSSRLGLIRSGAAKVMKSIMSTVSSVGQPKPTTSTSTAAAAKRPVTPTTAASKTKTPETKHDRSASSSTTTTVTTTTSMAPIGGKRAPVLGSRQDTSTAVPRVSSAPTARKASVGSANTTKSATSRATAPPVVPVAPPKIGRAFNTKQRAAMPSFEARTASLTSSIAPKSSVPSVASRRSVIPAASRRSSNTSALTASTTASSIGTKAKGPVVPSWRAPTTSSQARGASNRGSTSVAGSSIGSKTTTNSVPESRATNGSKAMAVDRDLDFEPSTSTRRLGGEEGDDEDGEDASSQRSASPLPAPPASLSSRPLQKRQPLTEVQPGTTSGDKSGSLGRKPRISRSKVIARVDATRKGAAGISSATSTVSTSHKARKSQGMTSKAKLLGGDGAKGRASAAAEAAKRKMRVSEAAARRRTMATQAAKV